MTDAPSKTPPVAYFITQQPQAYQRTAEGGLHGPNTILTFFIYAPELMTGIVEDVEEVYAYGVVPGSADGTLPAIFIVRDSDTQEPMAVEEAYSQFAQADIPTFRAVNLEIMPYYDITEAWRKIQNFLNEAAALAGVPNNPDEVNRDLVAQRIQEAAAAAQQRKFSTPKPISRRGR